MTQILIIGGGVVGLMGAWRLAQQGAKVTLLEKHFCGAGASGAALGTLITPKATRQSGLSALKRESLTLYPEMIKELASYSTVDTGFRQAGHIEVVCTERKIAEMHRDTKPAGATISFISAQEAHKLEPEIDFSGENVIGYDPTSISLSPTKLVAALLAACVAEGVTIREGVTVEKLIVEERVVKGALSAEKEPFFAAKTLISAAQGSERLLNQVNYHFPMTSIRGQAFVLKMDKNPLSTIIDYQFAKQDWIGEKLTINQWPNGKIAVGATVEKEQGLLPLPNQQSVAAMYADLCRIMPAAKNGIMDYAWAGLRPRGPTSKPFVGQVKTVQNLYLATGHSKIGFYLAPITGQQIAEMMLQNSQNGVC